MKIITYNVNGIRAALKKGFDEWIKAENFDIICLQEVKAEESQVDLLFLTELGYKNIVWHSAEKKGYSGVAIFSKLDFKSQQLGIGNSLYDPEGRFLKLTFDDFELINTYFPSGTSGDFRQDFKYEWLDYFYEYISEYKKSSKPLIILGDLNIAHQAMDIHNPSRNKNTSGFQPEEREWLTKFLDLGFVDSYRELNKDTQKYSWWSYRAGSRKKNLGWRIDYIIISEELKHRINGSDMLNDVIHSDHCPVLVDIK